MNPRPGLLRRTLSPRLIAGHLAVIALSLTARLPLRLTRVLGTALLPLYLPFRRRTRATLRRYTPHLTPLHYYRTRLQLALLSLRHATNRPDGCRHHVENTFLLDDALATGRPVVLLGWHQGPVELLHKVPAAHLDQGTRSGGERGLYLMTASAFSPPLAEWMASGRRAGRRAPMRLIRPGDTLALREWIKTCGLLAVMVDQVPGAPDDVLVPGTGMPAVPWPRRLMEWILAQDVEVLAISALWRPGRTCSGPRDQILIRYHPVGGAGIAQNVVKNRVAAAMHRALKQAPGQYNWSYGKIGSPE